MKMNKYSKNNIRKMKKHGALVINGKEDKIFFQVWNEISRAWQVIFIEYL